MSWEREKEETMSRSIVLAVDTKAAASELFTALTTSEGLRAFWTSDADGADEVGGALRFGFESAPVDLTATVDAITADQSITWGSVAPWPSWTGTTINWSIGEGSEGGRMVVFRHDGFADDVADAELGMVAITWAKVLMSLDAYAVSGAPAPVFA